MKMFLKHSINLQKWLPSDSCMLESLIPKVDHGALHIVVYVQNKLSHICNFAQIIT